MKAYTGVKVIDISEKELDKFYSEEKLNIDHLPMQEYYPNDCIVLKANNKQSALGLIKDEEVIKIDENICVSGITGINKEQRFALSLLNDETIKCLTLSGIAGGGKSILSLASALHQSVGKNAKYQKIIYIKSLDSVGPSLGYLPGELNEKVMPYMNALYDSLKILKVNKDAEKLTGMDESSKIQIMPHAFLRGRTLRKCFIIVEESQNLSTHEIKTILTRLDESSKIVLVGDSSQADVNYREEDKGFLRVIETFKDSELFGHVEFRKSQRSKLAQLVSERLI